jgi:lysophospholipase L1-like esterase
VFLNVPNVGGLPLLAGSSLAQRQAAQRASVGITRTVVNPVASDRVRVIDVMCNAALYQRSSLHADGFHPNDAGYAILAAEVVRAVTATSYPAPQANCAAMAQVP